MQRHLAFGALLLLLALACAPADGEEPLARARSPILGGRPSGDDENANVLLENRDAEFHVKCSGRFVAPGLVLTARHCVIRKKDRPFLCAADGSPIGAPTEDLRPALVEEVTVFVGSRQSSLRSIHVREIVTAFEVTVCRA